MIRPKCVLCGMPASHSAMFIIGGQPLLWPVCSECEARNGEPPQLLNPETMDPCRVLDILFDGYKSGDLSWEQLIFASKQVVPWWPIQGLWKAVTRAARARAEHYEPRLYSWLEELLAAATPPDDPFSPKAEIVIVKALAKLQEKREEEQQEKREDEQP